MTSISLLTSTKSGVAELLEPGVQGFVHDALDAAGLARSIELLRDPMRRNAMAAAARRLAEDHSLTAMARTLRALYAQLLSGRE